MDATLYELFPTAVMSFNTKRDLNDVEKEIIAAEMNNLGKSEGNWTGNDYQLLAKNEMYLLREELMNYVRIYFEHVFATSNKPELYMAQSWLNVTGTGEYHHAHTHSNSFLSGCYYYDVEPDDRIRFYNSPEINRMFSFSLREETKYNARTWWVPTKKNDVIIWRSDIPHDVPVIEKKRDRPRVSLAFNIFLRGTIGDDKMRNVLFIG